MMRLLIKCFYCFLLILYVSISQAEEPFFQYSDEPPPGFENFKSQQTTLVNVFYQGRELEPVVASFGDDGFRLLQPQQLVEQIPNLKPEDKQQLLLSFGGLLNENSKLICQQNRRIPVCKIPDMPRGSAIVFDESSLRLDVFVDAKFLLSNTLVDKLLPPSTANLSLNDKMTIAAGGARNFETNANNIAYNLNNDGSLAYASARINYNVAYATSGVENDIGQGQWSMRTLNGEWDYGRLVMQGGYIETEGNSFIGNQSLMGAKISTTLNTVDSGSLGNLFGAPLIVSLSLPSQVEIFRDNQLLSSAFYPAGQQQINTSALPTGSYPIRLVIRDNLGGEREETRFYNKSYDIPPAGYPLYFADAGYITSGVSNVEPGFFPQIGKIPFYQAGLSQRLTDNWGITSGLLGTTNNGYVDLGTFLLLPYYRLTIEPKVLAGINDDYGASLDVSALIDRLSVRLSGAKIWAENAHNSAQDDNTFDPLILDSSRLSMSVSFPLYTGSVSLLGQWNQVDNQEAAYSYGISTFSPLYSGNSTTINLQLSATRSSTDPLLALATLSIRLLDGIAQYGASTGYNYSELNRQNNGARMTVSSRWQKYVGNQYGYSLGIDAAKQVGQQEVGVDASNSNQYGNLSASTRYSSLSGRSLIDFSQTNPSLQYNLSASTNLVWVNNPWPYIGGGRTGNSTGVVVYIKSDQPGKLFELLSGQQVVGVVKTDSATPVALSPYRLYRLSIKAISSDAYFDYDERAKKVVLYPGNFQYLNWQAKERVIIFTQILTPSGAPLSNALEESESEFNATDENGFTQIETYKGNKQLRFITPTQQTCQINLPDDLIINQGVALIPSLDCQPISGSDSLAQ